MTHFRGQLRNDCRDALSDAARFAGFNQYRAISKDVDRGMLPFYVVRTPQEPTQWGGDNDFERITRLHVRMRRLGGDELEDTLDEDSDAVEAIVLPILEASGLDFSLDEVSIDVSDAGESRLGKLDMMFSVMRLSPPLGV